MSDDKEDMFDNKGNLHEYMNIKRVNKIINGLIGIP